MAIDTLFVYAGVYGGVDDAIEDYELIKQLHTEAGLIDAYDAAVVERNDKGKVKIVKKHETPTRVGGVLGGGSVWPPAWSSSSSRRPPSAAASSSARRPAEHCSGRSPVTPPRA